MSKQIKSVTIDSCPTSGCGGPLIGDVVGRRILISCSKCGYDDGVDLFSLETEFDGEDVTLYKFKNVV